MAIKAVVFDVSGTLLRSWPIPQPGIVDALDRLHDLGLLILAASNKAFAARQLRSTGLLSRIDHLVTQQEVGKPKGSPVWIDEFRRLTGFPPHELFYVGDSHLDMVTATRGPMIYAHALWAARRTDYGLQVSSPAEVVALIQHILRKQHPWYWTLNATDANSQPVTAMALLNAGGDNTDPFRRSLLGMLKDNRDSNLGESPLSLRSFVMLHMLASLYDSGLFGGVDFWTTYPGHAGADNKVMGEFLGLAAKLSRDNYRGDLFVRHRAALRSRAARNLYDPQGALRNQLDTVQLNAAYRRKLKDKTVLLLDNFLTAGYSTEAGRILLLNAGARSVVVAGVGKYGRGFTVVGAPGMAWDSFSTSRPDASLFTQTTHTGTVDVDAMTEFIASYRALSRETW